MDSRVGLSYASTNALLLYSIIKFFVVSHLFCQWWWQGSRRTVMISSRLSLCIVWPCIIGVWIMLSSGDIELFCTVGETGCGVCTVQIPLIEFKTCGVETVHTSLIDELDKCARVDPSTLVSSSHNLVADFILGQQGWYLHRSECFIVIIIYGWYQLFILIRSLWGCQCFCFSFRMWD